MAQLEVELVPALSDNYIYLAHEPESGETAVVDPAVAEPVLKAAEKKGWTISHILNTHHHGDHTGGNLEIQRATGAPIVGPKYDEARIPGLQVALEEGDTYKVGNAEAKVFFTPGHTRGHICFWFHNADVIFTGDTLFALGCGRLFEGDAAQMWNSLQKLRDLPPQTRIYCGHEYTQTNARCALSVDPDNAKLKERAKRIDELRAKGQPTIPSTLGEELETNPFLRADDPGLAQALGMGGADPVAVFAEVRQRRNNF
ncbi:hydroxyacylglutathione hydrolase [Ferruginivarius sediminum]|uniref:Hydroxyacylglutathione hydrolase n=1 Tax=Ferruginivarius sediminum TaxID=2661937 RepID=A0A369TBI6_9PROT|nr:hydroxyacylglutathione hydrolase [Ferruginivarius sediminum]RDD61755.1 hydroxyacylglutathione hydrolase [Ferruginivarius sediminum]